MSEAFATLFRLALPDGQVRLARGRGTKAPRELLAADVTLDRILMGPEGGLKALLTGPSSGPVPDGARILAPIEGQEVWGAGVTYPRSREGRMEESVSAASIYDVVYDAQRPELFHKAAGWRVRGPGDPVGVRADSTWDVPEPELAIFINSDRSIVGATISVDMSSRSIEAENPLYLPQAKAFEGSCALGPGIVPIENLPWPLTITMSIVRRGELLFRGSTDTGQARRSLAEITSWLLRAMSFPHGVVLMTGTGIVPPLDLTLHPGDRISVAIDCLGRLENVVEEVGDASEIAG